jgi:hypothetical protein
MQPFGRLAQSFDFIFEMQDSLGRKPWAWFARGSGVTDTVAFGRCMADTVTPAKVRAGVALATSLKLTATPTILLNGWRYGRPPADTELVRAIGDLLAKRVPYKGFPTKGLQ